MNIEDLIRQLEKIVEDMEQENLSLDDSMKLFNQGVELSQECFKELDVYKGQLTIINDKINKFNE